MLGVVTPVKWLCLPPPPKAAYPWVRIPYPPCISGGRRVRTNSSELLPCLLQHEVRTVGYTCTWVPSTSYKHGVDLWLASLGSCSVCSPRPASCVLRRDPPLLTLLNVFTLTPFNSNSNGSLYISSTTTCYLDWWACRGLYHSRQVTPPTPTPEGCVPLAEDVVTMPTLPKGW